MEKARAVHNCAGAQLSLPGRMGSTVIKCRLMGKLFFQIKAVTLFIQKHALVILPDNEVYCNNDIKNKTVIQAAIAVGLCYGYCFKCVCISVIQYPYQRVCLSRENGTSQEVM